MIVTSARVQIVNDRIINQKCLTRVAHSLYWMARYIERAENIARIVDVNLQLLLDLRDLDEKKLAEYWLPIVQSTGDEEAFFKLHPHATGQAVTEFLVFQTENPNSIVQSICPARENARMVRDQLTLELWEELNRLYLFVRSPQAREIWRRSPSEFFQEIKAGSLHLIGIINATLVHDEGWWFVQTGQFLERADKTTRILDVRYQTLPERGVPTDVNQTDGARMVGRAAFVQRLGRLPDHSRRGRPSAARGGISPAQRRFSALGAVLRERVEPRRPPDFRRGRGPFLQ